MEVKDYKDILPKLYELFPNIPESTIKYILKIGFARFTMKLLTNMDISVGTRNTGCYIYTPRSRNKLLNVLRKKSRFRYKTRKTPFHNVYYFGTTQEVYDNIKTRNSFFNLKNIYVTKDLGFVKEYASKYIFSLELTDVGTDFFIDYLRTDRVTMYAKRDKNNK